MVDGYAFFLHALLDLKQVGGLPYRLLVYSPDHQEKTAVDETLISQLRKMVWSYTYSQEYSMFVIHCENTTEAGEIYSFVKSLKGVTNVRTDIIEEQITVQDWIDDEIEMILTKP